MNIQPSAHGTYFSPLPSGKSVAPSTTDRQPLLRGKDDIQQFPLAAVGIDLPKRSSRGGCGAYVVGGLRYLYQQATGLPATAQSGVRRHLLACELNDLLTRLPDDDNLLAKLYMLQSRDAEVRRTALFEINPSRYEMVAEKAQKVVDDAPVSNEAVRALRKLLDRALGSLDSCEQARSALRKLYGNNHEDKIGRLDFGDEVANRWAKSMYTLLNTLKKALADPDLGPRLYAPGTKTLKTFIAGTFVLAFFFAHGHFMGRNSGD